MHVIELSVCKKLVGVCALFWNRSVRGVAFLLYHIAMGTVFHFFCIFLSDPRLISEFGLFEDTRPRSERLQLAQTPNFDNWAFRKMLDRGLVVFFAQWAFSGIEPNMYSVHLYSVTAQSWVIVFGIKNSNSIDIFILHWSWHHYQNRIYWKCQYH